MGMTTKCVFDNELFVSRNGYKMTLSDDTCYGRVLLEVFDKDGKKVVDLTVDTDELKKAVHRLS